MFAHMQKVIHGIDVDGGSDEQKAGLLLMRSFLPNAIRRTREKSHSARGSGNDVIICYWVGSSGKGPQAVDFRFSWPRPARLGARSRFPAILKHPQTTLAMLVDQGVFGTGVTRDTFYVDKAIKKVFTDHILGARSTAMSIQTSSSVRSRFQMYTKNCEGHPVSDSRFVLLCFLGLLFIFDVRFTIFSVCHSPQ